ncbi:MAG: glycosyltransferase family 2 protein [bacterium]
MMWSLLFWSCVVWLVYVYIGYPLLLGIIALVRPSRYRHQPGYQPTVTLLFSAKDEIADLPDKMANLRALDYPLDKMQIIVVSDGSTDGTADFLRQQTDVEVEILEQSIGKNRALNQVLPRATGEILFFTDANTLFVPSAVRAAVEYFADERVGCVTGELRFSSRGLSDSVGEVTGLYWRYENVVKRLETAVGSVLVGAGSLLAVRRERCGELYPDVANDFQLPMMVASAGDAVLYCRAFRGMELAASALTDEFNRTVRIVARGISGCRRLWRSILSRPLRLWQLISHKMMRWLVAPILFLLLLSTLGAMRDAPCTAILVIAICELQFYICAGIGGILHFLRLWPTVLYVPFHFLVLNLAALVGVIRGLTQGAPSAWNKPVSARDHEPCDRS